MICDLHPYKSWEKVQNFDIIVFVSLFNKVFYRLFSSKYLFYVNDANSEVEISILNRWREVRIFNSISILWC